MERRQIAGTAGASAIAAGVAMGIASLQPALDPYRVLLACFSSGSLGVGVTAWGALWLTAVNKDGSGDRGYLTTLKAGGLLYERSSKLLRKAMIEGVPNPFESLEQAGSAYVHAAMKARNVQFYARRGESLRLEPISEDEANPNSFRAIFDGPPKVRDISMRRRDLRKVVSYYKSPGRL